MNTEKPLIQIIGEELLPTAIWRALFPPNSYRCQYQRSLVDQLGTSESALILLNIRSPDRALKLLGHLHQSGNTIPVIWLTDQSDAQATANAFLLGATNVLLNPDPVKIRATVDEQLCACVAADAKVNSVRRAVFDWFQPRETPAAVALPSSNALQLSVQFFGTLQLHLDGRPLRIKLTNRERSLLAYFLYHHHQVQHSDRLVETFWPGHNPESGRNSLHVCISKIRGWARAEAGISNIIESQHACYSLSNRLEVTSDCQQFRYHFQRALAFVASGKEEATEELVAALQYYQERFLEDLYHEPWVQVLQATLEENYLQVLNRLGDQLLANEQYDAVVELSNRILRTNAYSEAAYLRMARAYQALGYRDQALQQLTKCQSKLRELKLRPTAEMLALIQVLIGVGEG